MIKSTQRYVQTHLHLHPPAALPHHSSLPLMPSASHSHSLTRLLTRADLNGNGHHEQDNNTSSCFCGNFNFIGRGSVCWDQPEGESSGQVAGWKKVVSVGASTIRRLMVVTRPILLCLLREHSCRHFATVWYRPRGHFELCWCSILSVGQHFQDHLVCLFFPFAPPADLACQYLSRQVV